MFLSVGCLPESNDVLSSMKLYGLLILKLTITPCDYWHLISGLTQKPSFPYFLYFTCLSVSIAMTRHYDHDNSYLVKHLIKDGLHFQRFSPVS